MIKFFRTDNNHFGPKGLSANEEFRVYKKSVSFKIYLKNK